MKKTLHKRMLALVLLLAMLLPNWTGAVSAFRADATESVTYGEANIYDISDLTGSETNTIKGTNDTWEGVVLGTVSPEHKENIVFKTILTMGQQEVRLALNAKEGTSIYDPPGYAVYINHNGGAPYVAVKRNQSDLVVGSVPSVDGTYELEIGILDILTGGVRTGKHIYVKMGGQLICEADDLNGYLTGDTLGTRFVDFHYGAAIQMDTAKTNDNTYATANVYDIYDLTGSETNTINGTDATWDGVVLGNVSPEHKENIVFKTKLTMGQQQVRLALNAKDGTSIYDPPGYAVYMNHNGGAPYIAIKRNQMDLAVCGVAVEGSYELEIGILDILTDGERTGKYLYVKKDGEIVCEANDTVGYLTGDALGTKIVDFHYGAAIQMDSTKEVEPEVTEATEPEETVPQTVADPVVYDIWDLTGKVGNTYYGAQAGSLGIPGVDDRWSDTVIGNVKVEDKENILFKTKMTVDAVRTDGPDTIRLSIGLLENANAMDFGGYCLRIIVDTDGKTYFGLYRNGENLAYWEEETALGTYELEFAMQSILEDGQIVGKRLTLKKDGQLLNSYDDKNGYLTGAALGTKAAIFHYVGKVVMDSTKEIEPEVTEPTEPEVTEPTEPEVTEPTVPQTVANATVYDLYALKGTSQLTIAGQLQGVWGTTLGHVDPSHKTNVAFKSDITVDEPQTILLGLGIGDMSQAVRLDSGYVLEIVNQTGDGKPDTVKIHRGGTQIYIRDTEVDFHGEHTLEYGFVDILEDEVVVGKRIYVNLDDAEVLCYDDMTNFLTAENLGTKVDIYVSGNDLLLGSAKNYAASDANVYDLYDLQGVEKLTLEGRTTNPDNWGTTLGNVQEEHKENVAFKTTVTMDEAQTVMLGIGLTELSSAAQLSSGYVLEIVMTDEVDTVKIHRAGTQIYCEDQSLDFNGEYELEFGVVDLCDMDADGVIVGKRIYVKVNGEEIVSYDDTVNALAGDDLGTKVDVYVSGVDLPMYSYRGYQASSAKVYDLYDLLFRETLEVHHSDDNGEVIWGVLIGNVEEADKGNVALKTKVTMSRSQQQNLIIGLGLNGHWPVGSGHGYKFELNGNPDNATDRLYIYKNTEGEDPVCIYNMEQDFDFNSSFQLEVGVVDLLDSNKKAVARRIYMKIDGKELMHFDDTRDVISAGDMGTVVAAYASSGSVTLGTCVSGIPHTDVKVYDIFDLSGRATLKLARTDAGGEVIWSNEIGQITDTNQMNYALRVNMDTGKVSRSSMQELIMGLCKDTDLFDKMGYRLSFYFQTDGSTSLVLRDSATDEVLASVNSVLPKAFELELGMTDFYSSSKVKLGNKIYVKIDGEEVLSYLDKDANRARGNLMCAYTTSPVTMITKYGYCTIPVTYVVNGENVENSQYITANTDVVAGKKSIIDIALGNKDEFTSVVIQRILLNGEQIKPISDKKGVYVYELESPSQNDEMTVEIQVHNLTVDEAEVYDLYELTGKKEIIIPAASVDQIGTLFADGREGVLNRAIRFAYYIPKTGGGVRLGYGSDTSDIWSRVGTHIELWCGFATISHGFHVSALSSNNTDIFKADSWSIVEVGIVKCYEDGVYKYDRWYVKAGSTPDALKLITYYDSTQRYDSSLNIMARTPDTGDDFILASTMEVRQVTDISEETVKSEASVAFKPLFLKGEAVKIVVFPMEGKKLDTLTVNGQPVEAVLNSDGGYAFVLENAQEDINFNYSLSDDNSTYHITAEDAENLKFILDQTSVTAGGSVTVQIKMDGGYTLKSLLVNGADFLPMASYDKTTLTYTLTISGIREDKRIQAQAEKLSQDGPVAEGNNATNAGRTNLTVIIAIAALAAVVLGGAVIVMTRARKKEQKR